MDSRTALPSDEAANKRDDVLTIATVIQSQDNPTNIAHSNNHEMAMVSAMQPTLVNNRIPQAETIHPFSPADSQHGDSQHGGQSPVVVARHPNIQSDANNGDSNNISNNNNNNNNWQRLLSKYRSMSRGYKIGLALQTVFTFATAISTIVVLAVSQGERCSAPLEVFLSVYVVIGLISWPATVHRYLYPSPLNDIVSRTEAPGCMEEVKSYLDVLAAVWFVLGNYWLFGSSDCTQTAPARFFMSLFYIIVGYLLVLLPLIMICSMLMCMPFVIICLRSAQRALGIQIEPRIQNAIINPFSRVRGLNNAQIQLITPFEFHGARMERANNEDDEDATCSICLVEYSDGEKLKRLPGCRHHFHADCVDHWLLINKTCPLCVRDISIELELSNKSVANV